MALLDEGRAHVYEERPRNGGFSAFINRVLGPCMAPPHVLEGGDPRRPEEPSVEAWPDEGPGKPAYNNGPEHHYFRGQQGRPEEWRDSSPERAPEQNQSWSPQQYQQQQQPLPQHWAHQQPAPPWVQQQPAPPQPQQQSPPTPQPRQQQQNGHHEQGWVPPKDDGHATAELREKLCSAYGMTPQDAQWAMEFAESATMADIFGFAFAVAGCSLQEASEKALRAAYKKEKLVEKFGGKSAGEKIPAERRAARQKALDDYEAGQQAEELDLETFREDETARLEGEVEGLPLEEALRHLGVPGPRFDETAVQKALHPTAGAELRSARENATRTAAYDVALSLLDGEED